ncbi:MAG: Spore germination protein A1 [Firmicutes bacterium]|nr:Spore germination protein A1 [candidate division NPL-UPA2 bacterium]
MAAISFHHGILPPALFRSIQTAREGVPLPTVAEMFVLLIAFDLIVEASTRMPMRVGQALGIVGGIILGQAAVQAGFVSPGKVIIVSLTGLATFTQPSPSMLGPLRVLKYIVLVFCSTLGLFGAMWGLILLALQVSALRSFGYPYMYPLSPFALANTPPITADRERSAYGRN